MGRCLTAPADVLYVATVTSAEPGGLEVLKRPGDVGHLSDGQVLDGARGRFVRRDGDLGGTLVGDHHARGAHDFGRAHDSAEIAGVGDMVENHHQGGCVGRGGGDDVRESSSARAMLGT